MESIVLSHATALVGGANKATTVTTDLNVDNSGDREVGGTSFSVLISEQENYNGEVMLHHELRWTSRHKKDHPLHLPPSKALNYLAKLVLDQAITAKGVSISGVTLHCFMEHNHKGFILLAHPDYQHKIPWYD